LYVHTVRQTLQLHEPVCLYRRVVVEIRRESERQAKHVSRFQRVSLFRCGLLWRDRHGYRLIFVLPKRGAAKNQYCDLGNDDKHSSSHGTKPVSSNEAGYGLWCGF
jgi:hypothetical protein